MNKERIEQERKRFEEYMRNEFSRCDLDRYLSGAYVDHETWVYLDRMARRSRTGGGMNNQMRPMTDNERKQADEFLETQTKSTGILDRLSPEERKALREVCAYAHVYLDVFCVPSDDIKRKQIKQLLGEEK